MHRYYTGSEKECIKYLPKYKHESDSFFFFLAQVERETLNKKITICISSSYFEERIYVFNNESARHFK